MGLVRNDFGEIRVTPTLDYTGIEPEGTVDVSCRVPGCQEPGHPEENVYHWVAGGWTPLSRYPVPELLYPNHRDDPLAYPVAPDAGPLASGGAVEPGGAVVIGPGPAALTLPPAVAVRGEPGPEVTILPPGQPVAPAAEVSAAPEGEAK